MSLAVLTTGSAVLEVRQGRVCLPRIGVWTARLELDDEVAPPAGAAAVLQLGGDGDPTELRGVLVRAGAWQGSAWVGLAGGRGMIAQLEPRDYVAPAHPTSLAEIVVDLVADAGEDLATGVAAALAGRGVARWTRLAGRASRALRALVEEANRAALAPELAWRVLLDGSVWVGQETWPEIVLEGERFYDAGDDPEDRLQIIYPDAATLVPGVVIVGRRIQDVAYLIDEQRLSAELRYSL